jgi:menaquinone-dependent protoporphyrinogen oxidase
MKDRTLVVYATKHGATEEIADVLADELRLAGADVELADAAEIDDLDRYRTIVLGSAVYMGRWRPEARRFLKKHQRELAGRELWLFSSGPVGKEEQEDPCMAIPGGMRKLGEKLGAREHAVFGGRVRTDSGSFIERAIANDTPEDLRDRRDWDEIRAWARKIASARLERAKLVV